MFVKSNSIYINNEPIDVMQFSGGEVQVRVPEVEQGSFMTAFLNSSDAILEMILALDAAKDYNIRELTIPYLPYARQDRICAKGEAFSLQVMAELLINSSSADFTIFDPHSSRALDFLDDTRVVHPHQLFSIIPNKYTYIIAPDKGAVDRATAFGYNSGTPIIAATKERDPTTGEITNTAIQLPTTTSKYLIVDDICDGGRTFIELAKVMRSQVEHPITIDLWTTHGIFSQGFDVFKEHIDNIYYSNSRNQDGTGNPYNIHHKEI